MKAIHGSGAPATLDRWGDCPDAMSVNADWWNGCQRGDWLLWVAEVRGAPDAEIAAALEKICALSEELCERLGRQQLKWDRNLLDALQNHTAWGDTSDHAAAHRLHAIADCNHSVACALHWLSHRGGGYPALCAMHYHDARLLGDFRFSRDEAEWLARAETAKIVRECITSVFPHQ